MTTPILKPCPFCGGTNVLVQQNVKRIDGSWAYWLSSCSDCEFEGRATDSQGEAVLWWNQQALTAERDALTVRVAILEKALKPFANCVYYDNGDVTISMTYAIPQADFINAYFALNKVSKQQETK
jgi:Lar family restriction alleviation protein